MVQAKSHGDHEMPGDDQLFIQLGFLEAPKNSLVTKPQFTPSKIGGDPAWIAPAIPEEQLVCERCNTPFCFIAQVYANLEHLADYHRMLYLFACVSPLCIKRSDCVRAYRFLNHDRNPHVAFVSDDDYNFVVNKPDESLRTSRLAHLFDEEVDSDEDDHEQGEEVTASDVTTPAKVSAKKSFGALSFKPRLEEYLIESCEEALSDTQMYVRQARRLAQKIKGAQMSEEDLEMAEQLEHAFAALSFDKGKSKSIDKQVEKMLAAYKSEAIKEGSAAADDESAGIEDEEMDNGEVRALEELIKENHQNTAKISGEYKLFDVITAKQPSQVLRYSQQQALVQIPLWVSDRHKPGAIPPCARCGSQRVFEFQLTP